MSEKRKRLTRFFLRFEKLGDLFSIFIFSKRKEEDKNFILKGVFALLEIIKLLK